MTTTTFIARIETVRDCTATTSGQPLFSAVVALTGGTDRFGLPFERRIAAVAFGQTATTAFGLNLVEGDLVVLDKCRFSPRSFEGREGETVTFEDLVFNYVNKIPVDQIDRVRKLIEAEAAPAAPAKKDRAKKADPVL